MMSRKRTTGGTQQLCTIVSWAVCLLLLVIMIAALKGAYLLNVDPGRTVLGSSSSSFSLLAASICTALWSKSLRRCLRGCEEKK